MTPAPPPPAFYVVATVGDRKAWLLGPYPDRPTAEFRRWSSAYPRHPYPDARVATAPAGVAITTVFGA